MLKLIHNNKDHNNVSELLPWYVNQTLTPSELESVEKHIRVCEACQQEIELLQTTFKAANDFDAAVIPCDKRFNAIMQRIDRTDDTQPDDQQTNDQQKIRKPAAFAWYQKPQMAIAASFLGAMLMAYWASSLFEVTYTDESGDNKLQEVLNIPDPGPIDIKVSFANSISNDEAQRIITAIDDRLIVNGNRPDYTVNLPADYDPIKANELIKTLNSKNMITNVNIVRENK